MLKAGACVVTGFTLVAIAVIGIGAGSRQAQETSRMALLDAGYSNIEITGSEWYGCSEDDTYTIGFRANGPTGRPVKGVVCSDYFKGTTIRNTGR